MTHPEPRCIFTWQMIKAQPGQAGYWRCQQLPGLCIRHDLQQGARRPFSISGMPGSFADFDKAAAAAEAAANRWLSTMAPTAPWSPLDLAAGQREQSAARAWLDRWDWKRGKRPKAGIYILSEPELADLMVKSYLAGNQHRVMARQRRACAESA